MDNPQFVLALVRETLSNARISASGWLKCNCPACGDTRRRGSYLETPTGGFRYGCHNGGCTYETPTGWEPGHTLTDRAKVLLFDLARLGDRDDTKLSAAVAEIKKPDGAPCH